MSDTPTPKPTTPPQQTKVDSTSGTISIPGVGTKPMVGIDPGQLSAKAKENARRKLILERQMRSTYRCLQCKRKWSGKHVRVKIRREGGVNMEVLVCPDPKCDGPTVMVEDALSLLRPPGGDRSAV